ncbi:hypothetical protein PGTUg99_004151 [Puccinia graminis f. sp. tritici]|uniref:Uncharacterized protein n=1 Tax=Puccinia graminis f. sp. tritici TaxID=56615 RepID=A0A5B0NCH6_PUCGR|nr:hypothetical protein PGTUg99_004151 [Puccinia graminis f. sp. tritici]
MRARISGPGRSSNHARILMGPSSYAPNGFQSFYPIVIPPGFTGVYPPAPAFSPSTNTIASKCRPRNSTTTGRLLPPTPIPPAVGISTVRINQVSEIKTSTGNNPNGKSTARMVELDDVAEDLANINFGHVQADMNDNFPIVDSATLGNPAFITGKGDLTFSGLDNQSVTIHSVHNHPSYMEQFFEVKLYSLQKKNIIKDKRMHQEK